ncbi:hypothetical protein HNQ93_003470 [Hymenobacter luteus]|uniref:Uncharacterized protein n=2 Tax=Hymenobacter TaxID=89966 RepID=A0A7W9T382_9BACT|nr:hypothetical protein [Hymenobacter luteus]MBB4602705.1 hypothetical protein [Hymenobacter latericoloratus]MBB6060596.1 hypothetical protein [Hymenobacter luteus]
MNDIPKNIKPEDFVDELLGECAVICNAPNEHPSECPYLVITPSGERIAKFKNKESAVSFILNCLKAN